MKLFVYGTLKKGFINHSCLGTDAKFLGPATIVGFELRDNGVYPYAFRSNTSFAKGELYEISPVSFKRCDLLEGYPHHYNRSNVPVYFLDEENEEHYTQAWVYHAEDSRLNRNNYNLVINNEWKKR